MSLQKQEEYSKMEKRYPRSWSGSLNYKTYLAVLVVCGAAFLLFSKYQPFHAPELTSLRTEMNGPASVVFLVRTFAGHFDHSNMFNILRLIESLQNLNNKDWHAFLVNTDTKPLPIAGHPLEEIMAKDSRIQFMFAPVQNSYNKWVAGYDVTDIAISSLKMKEYKWLVITNGDNTYEPQFLDYLGDADIIAFDYWSRWTRVDNTVPITDYSKDVCHAGRLQPGFVDMGGVILSFPRFISEGHKFMSFGEVNGQDGLMFTKLNFLQWKPKIIKKCLFSHSPNPVMCAKLGGTWWNSPASLDALSAGCLTNDQASALQALMNPKPLLSKSKSGIPVLTLPEPQHKQNFDNMMVEQQHFAAEYASRMGKVLCCHCVVAVASLLFL